MYDLQTFCKLYCLDAKLPIYLYKNKQPHFSTPDQESFTWPPEKYASLLLNSNTSVSYCSSDYGVFFGSIQKEHSDWHLIIGPVSAISYTDSDMHQLYRDYFVPYEKRSEFHSFLDSFQHYFLEPFLEKLIFINYCLNEMLLDMNDIFDLSPEKEVSHELTNNTYTQKESLKHNESYKVESFVTNIIKKGKPEDLAKLSFYSSNYNPGLIAPSALRQLKNTLIVSITLATRAAIEGGLDYDTAYLLSDLYIQKAEHTNTPDALYALMSQVNYEFAKRVQDCKMPITSNDILQKAILFIQQHTNCHISAAEVADHVGFSRAYFSTYFKKHLGFSISDFILRCKLEESKQLLQYTTKSLPEISNYLCFSSQSHFQTVFKKQYNITPLQYRKNPDLKTVPS